MQDTVCVWMAVLELTPGDDASDRVPEQTAPSKGHATAAWVAAAAKTHTRRQVKHAQGGLVAAPYDPSQGQCGCGLITRAPVINRLQAAAAQENWKHLKLSSWRECGVACRRSSRLPAPPHIKVKKPPLPQNTRRLSSSCCSHCLEYLHSLLQ